MGWFSGKSKSETPTVSELLKMDDRKLKEVIARGKVPQKTPKELRKAAREAVRRTEGERGIGALLAGTKGGGAKNYHNVPLKDRVHPAEYRRILQREAKRQGLL